MLTSSQFTHFISLHVAIRILVATNLCIKYNNYARQLLLYFIEKYSVIYGREHITHNVHNLLHLCDDVLHNNGPLDHFSSFPYENCLQNIKKKMKCSRHPLQQIANRIQEEEIFFGNLRCDNDNPVLKGINTNFQTSAEFQVLNSYNTFKTKSLRLSLRDDNNCVMLKDESVVILKSIIQTKTSGLIMIGNKFASLKPFFTNPCPSTIVHSYCVKGICNTDIRFTYTDIKHKCLKLNLNAERNEFVVMCLLHDITV